MGMFQFLPTTSYFHGLAMVGEEISIEIEEGKTLVHQTCSTRESPMRKGVRSLTFELNGKARTTLVEDKSVKGEAKAREKADPANPLHIGAPIPAMISSIATSVGKSVKKGDKIAVLEAMKMQTTLYASADGCVDGSYGSGWRFGGIQRSDCQIACLKYLAFMKNLLNGTHYPKK